MTTTLLESESSSHFSTHNILFPTSDLARRIFKDVSCSTFWITYRHYAKTLFHVKCRFQDLGSGGRNVIRRGSSQIVKCSRSAWKFPITLTLTIRRRNRIVLQFIPRPLPTNRPLDHRIILEDIIQHPTDI